LPAPENWLNWQVRKQDNLFGATSMNSERPDRSHEFVLTIVLSLILLALLVTSIWAVNKGFDFSDEAYSYLGFRKSGRDRPDLHTLVRLFVSLFGWSGLGIITVRILRIVILLSCTTVFVHGLVRRVKRSNSFTEMNTLNLRLLVYIGRC